MHMENSLPAKMPTETSADNVSQLKSNRISIFEQKNRIIGTLFSYLKENNLLKIGREAIKFE